MTMQDRSWTITSGGCSGVAAGEGGSLFSLTIGDKGCYLAVAFGAPVTHAMTRPGPCAAR